MRNLIDRALAGLVAIWNEAVTVESLQNKLIQLNDAANSVQAQADADKRPLTEDEERQVADIFATFELTEAEIDRRQRIAGMGAKVNAPGVRMTRDDPAPNSTDPDPAVASQPRPLTRSAPNAAGRSPRIEMPGASGAWGWRSFGEFAAAVRRQATPGGASQMDPRLVANAPTTYSQEGVGADGGFAVPPDFRTEIMRKVMGEDSLLGRTDQQTSSSNVLVVPKDETTPWQSSGGIQAYWEGEAGLKTQSKISLSSIRVQLNKVIALVPVTDELLEDAGSLSNYLRTKAPEKIDFKVTDAIVNGTGAGMPLGILNSGAKVTVNPESGQAADTVRFENIVNMWTRMYAPCRRNAIWLAHQDVESQLMSMQFPGTGTAVPVFIPPGGLSSSPYGQLMGRPIVPSESMPALGDAGDLTLVDLTKYLSVVRTGGIRADVSIHLWFDYDVTAFRFVLRVGGQPWWSSAITPKNGNNTRSCIVTLGERA